MDFPSHPQIYIRSLYNFLVKKTVKGAPFRNCNAVLIFPFGVHNALLLTKLPSAYIVSLGLEEEKSSPDSQELA